MCVRAWQNKNLIGSTTSKSRQKQLIRFFLVFVPTGRRSEGHHGVPQHLGRSYGVLQVPERQANRILFTAEKQTPTARPIAGLRPLAGGTMKWK